MEFQINKKDLEKINILNTQLGYPQGIFYFLRKKKYQNFKRSRISIFSQEK